MLEPESSLLLFPFFTWSLASRMVVWYWCYISRPQTIIQGTTIITKISHFRHTLWNTRKQPLFFFGLNFFRSNEIFFLHPIYEARLKACSWEISGNFRALTGARAMFLSSLLTRCRSKNCSTCLPTIFNASHCCSRNTFWVTSYSFTWHSCFFFGRNTRSRTFQYLTWFECFECGVSCQCICACSMKRSDT